MRVGLARARVGLMVAVVVVLVGGSFAATNLSWPHGQPRSIQVVRVWSDGVDARGSTVYYLLDVNLTNGQASTWQVDPSYFSLTSNASRTYLPADYNETAVLGASTIPPGKSVVAELAFLLPAAERPLKLSYDDARGNSAQATNIPAVSGMASRFDPSVHLRLNGTSAVGAVANWGAISNQTGALGFFGGEPGYRNYSFVFFTGQRIYVALALYYYRVPSYPNSIVVESVKSGDGYAVSDVLAWDAGFTGSVQAQALPVTMTGYGASVDITLVVTVPPGPQPGVLHFTVQFSS